MNRKIALILPLVLQVCAQSLAALYLLGFALWYGLADGLKDSSGTPLGADFLNVYAAGLMVNRGEAALAYDWQAHWQVQRGVSGYDSAYFGWHYPPMFLAVASLVALVPYLWAFAVYIVVTFAGYWAVMRRLAAGSRMSLWLLAAFPGVFANIINGQNGFITTALFGAGMSGLEENPWVAGVLLGLLSYKPQFFVVIPLVLAVGGYGRAVVASCLTALVSAGVSWAIFGSATWMAFFGSARLTQHVILEQGSTGWKKIQSVFSLVRMWGGSVEAAYALQAGVAVIAIALALWVWRKKAPMDIRVAALCGAMLLATPYLLDYDLVILAVPFAFMLRRGLAEGFRRYEAALLGLLWILPLLARELGGAHIPTTPFVLAGMMGLCVFWALYPQGNKKVEDGD